MRIIRRRLSGEGALFFCWCVPELFLGCQACRPKRVHHPLVASSKLWTHGHMAGRIRRNFFRVREDSVVRLPACPPVRLRASTPAHWPHSVHMDHMRAERPHPRSPLGTHTLPRATWPTTAVLRLQHVASCVVRRVDAAAADFRRPVCHRQPGNAMKTDYSSLVLRRNGQRRGGARLYATGRRGR